MASFVGTSIGGLFGAFAVLAGTSTAMAVPVKFDFVEIVAQIGEQGADGQPLSQMVDDILVSVTDQSFKFKHVPTGLTATVKAFNGGGAIHPYLDSLSGGLPAGMGACAKVTGSYQCTPSSDDNVTKGEKLEIHFTDHLDKPMTVTLDEVTYYNGKHKTNFDGDVDLYLNNAFAATLPLAHMSPAGMTGHTMLWHNNNTPTSNTYQFYVGALTAHAAPEPGTLALLAAGVAGTALFRRRACQR